MSRYQYIGSAVRQEQLKVGDQVAIEGQTLEVVKVEGDNVFLGQPRLDLSGVHWWPRFGLKVLALIGGVKVR